MLHDWTIHARADHCAVTEEVFTAGQPFFTLLYRDKKEGLIRRDVSQTGWKQIRSDPKADKPFSFWKSKFVPPPPPAPEAIARNDAEALLRRFLEAGVPEERRAVYILTLMLERKRILRPTGVAEEDGHRLLLYEHARTGETFVVVDPELRLDQVARVQEEVIGLLTGAAMSPPEAAPSPAG